MSSSGVFFFVSERPEESRRVARIGSHARQRLVRFPGTQPLIHHFHGKAKGFLDARRKTLRFFRHLARRAIQMQRKPNHNAANFLLADQFAQAGEIAAAVDPGPCRVGPGSHAKFIRKRQPQPLFSVIDRKNHTRSVRTCRQGLSTEGIRHANIITRKEGFSEARGNGVASKKSGYQCTTALQISEQINSERVLVAQPLLAVWFFRS